VNGNPPFSIVFFRTSSGREPVRDWLKDLDNIERKVIGEDVKLLQFRWPLGMPLVRKLEPDLWEVRSHMSGKRIARILFTVHGSEPFTVVKLRSCMALSRKPKKHLRMI
jgi:phage-related protein